MLSSKPILVAFAFVVGMYAQPQQVQVNADCVLQFNITTSGGTSPTSGGFDNRRVGCNSWQISYANNTFAAITLAIQEAPDSAGSPGAWGTLGGTATFGVNPNTNTTGASSLVQSYGTNFAPWVRVALTSATGSGSVVGILLGYRAAGSAGTSGGGTGTQNVNLLQVATVATASDGNGGIVPGGVSTAMVDAVSNTGVIPQADNAGTPAASAVRDFPLNFNGSTWDRQFVCPSSVEVALSGTGYTQIIALSGSTVIRICKVAGTSASGGNPSVNTFTFAYGTGSNCAAGTTELQNMAGITGLDSDYGGALRTAAGNAFCIKESVANSDKFTVTYAQY